MNGQLIYELVINCALITSVNEQELKEMSQVRAIYV